MANTELHDTGNIFKSRLLHLHTILFVYTATIIKNHVWSFIGILVRCREARLYKCSQ